MLTPTDTTATPAPARPQPDTALTQLEVEPVLLRQLVQGSGVPGLTFDALCRGLGFDAANLEDPDFRLSPAQTERVLRRALRLDPQPALGLRLGASASVASWGLCLVGLLACGSVREVLAMAADFAPPTHHLLKLEGLASGDEFGIVAEPVFTDPPIQDFLTQYAFAALARVSRFVVAPWFHPRRVEFRSPQPLDVDLAMAAFGCAVHTGCRADRIVFTLIDHPIATADAGVARMVRRQLTPPARGGAGPTELEAAVLRAIRSQLGAVPTARAFAATMNMSERTLRRRLQEIDLSYGSLIDQERMRRALALLQDRHLRYEDVALACGLSDPRALRRAVQRWTGRTPTQIRNNRD